MTAAVFYAVTSAVSLAAIAAEAAYSRRAGRRWHVAADTAGNLNLAAGNVLLGVLLAWIVATGYGALLARRVADVHAVLGPWATIVVAVLFADFLQYWNHRLSHRVNVLWWGHVTHHSSSQLNLSTGVRINWLYRSYAWLLYAPMPLLGFSLEEFVLSQVVINVYNLFMHTRGDVSFGPLAWVLVTPASHRLHHSADPTYFGNYGAALIVWDRLFGTYREVPSVRAGEEIPFGIGRNVDSSDPLRLNFHYLVDLWSKARRERRSFVRLVFSPVEPEPASRVRAVSSSGALPVTAWLGLSGTAVLALLVNQFHAGLSPLARVFAVCAGLVLITGFGITLERRLRR
jgi:alkylglycerol monooxygenase